MQPNPAYSQHPDPKSNGGVRYWRATEVVEQFKQPFDRNKEAEAYAAKHGQTAQYWLDQWDSKKKKRQEFGNEMHDNYHLIDQGRMIGLFQQLTMPVWGEANEGIPWMQRPDGIYTERNVWHHGFQVIGRPDRSILLTDHDLGKRFAHVEDYKTNEQLHKISYQFKSNGNYKMMKSPIGHIMDCNWFHHCLQLSLYMFMFEYQGFKPGSLTILHSADGGKPQRHDAPYLKREVIQMLNSLRGKAPPHALR